MTEADIKDLRTLNQHVHDMFAAHDRIHKLEGKALILAKANADKNLQIALAALDQRLAGMNEIRATLSDFTAEAVTRVEWSSHNQLLDDRFRALERLVYMAMGGVTLAGLTINLVMYFLGKKS